MYLQVDVIDFGLFQSKELPKARIEVWAELYFTISIALHCNGKLHISFGANEISSRE